MKTKYLNKRCEIYSTKKRRIPLNRVDISHQNFKLQKEKFREVFFGRDANAKGAVLLYYSKRLTRYIAQIKPREHNFHIRVKRSESFLCVLRMHNSLPKLQFSASTRICFAKRDQFHLGFLGRDSFMGFLYSRDAGHRHDFLCRCLVAKLSELFRDATFDLGIFGGTRAGERAFERRGACGHDRAGLALQFLFLCFKFNFL